MVQVGTVVQARARLPSRWIPAERNTVWQRHKVICGFNELRSCAIIRGADHTLVGVQER